MTNPKLFVPRKNYLEQARGGTDTLLRGLKGDDQARIFSLLAQIARDEITNYLAIERWANMLPTITSGVRSDLRIVAAHNSWSVAQNGADYVCAGTNDDATIQTAINDVNNINPAGTGTVLLAPGAYQFGTGGINGYGGVSLKGMGFPTADIASSVRLNIPAAATKGVHDLAGMEGIGVVMGTPATALTEAVVFEPLIMRDCRIQSGVVTAGNNVLLQCAGNVIGVYERNWFQTSAGATGFTCIASNNVSGNADEVWIRDNYIIGGLGISLSGIKQIVTENYLQQCYLGAITLDSSTVDSLIDRNQIAYGTTTTTDGITVAGTRNTIRGNIVRRDTGSMRNGVNVLAGASACIVVENDLNLSGTVNSFLDAGTGTIKNYDGSANNWNLL